jgi:NodT family efflux transporter outer membrane factor (OMF) lipoprotein
MTHHRLNAAVAALFLAGCTVGPDYRAPETPTYDEWGELVAADAPPSTQPTTRPTAAPPVVRWWTTFNDPALDDLIATAVKGNLDLRRAQARVRETRALRDVSNADLFPDVNVSGSYTHSRSPADAFGPVTPAGGTSGGTTTGGGGTTTGGTSATGTGFTGFAGSEQNFYQAGFDSAWEIDLFGGNRRNVEAATADLAAAVESRRDTLVTLLAEVARNYVELRGFQRQIVIAQENLRAQQQTLDLTRDRLRAGIATDLDVARAQAQVATTASTIPTLEAGARMAIHRLGVLAGMTPVALAQRLSQVQPIPQPPPQLPVGVPSDLLRRRPDVRRAERELAASSARIGAATADLFPRFSLTGSLGLQSSKSSDLLNYSSRFWSIGPSISWPVFDAGRIRANIRVQNAREEQAAAAYQQAILTAFQETEDALVSYVKEENRRRVLAQAVAANRRAVALAIQLNEAGRVDFLSVLQAQRDLFTSQDALVQSDRTVTTNLVTLYKVLGGGWETSETPAPAQ